MFKHTFLALAATCGLMAGTASTAEAQQFSVGVGNKSGSFGLSVGSYNPYAYGYGAYGTGLYGSGLYGSAVATYPTTPVIVAPTYVQYVVYYRTCAHDPWRVYASFLSHNQSHQAMHMLRLQGYQAREAVY